MVNATTESQPITAQEFMDLIRSVKLRIPEYGQLPTASRKAVQTIVNIHPLFKAAAIGGLAASPAIAAAVGLTADEVNAMDGDAEAWDNAIEEVRGLLKGMTAANLKRRHRIGLAALQSYSITGQLVRHENHSDLLATYDEMKRTSRLRRRRRATSPQPGPITPQPETPTK
jgi:type IV secretory pathway VirB2 component (pilin)